MEYSIELAQPDLSPYAKGNDGIAYAFTFKSGVPGPHIWLNSITHGDETCGAIALDWLLQSDIRPKSGVLSLSFSNLEAFHNTSHDNPLGTRFLEEDMNRVWDKFSQPAKSYERKRAAELRPLADQADILIDIHAMHHPSEPLAIVGKVDSRKVMQRGEKLIRKIGYPTLLIADAGHSAGCRLRDYGRFGGADSHATSLVVECGGWWQKESAEIAKWIAVQTLVAHGAISEDEFEVGLPTKPNPKLRLVEARQTITIETEEFHFTEAFKGDEVIPDAGTVIGYDGKKPVTTPCDDCFLMFPTRAPRVGDTAVRLGRFSTLAG